MRAARRLGRSLKTNIQSVNGGRHNADCTASETTHLPAGACIIHLVPQMHRATLSLFKKRRPKPRFGGEQLEAGVFFFFFLMQSLLSYECGVIFCVDFMTRSGFFSVMKNSASGGETLSARRLMVSARPPRPPPARRSPLDNWMDRDRRRLVITRSRPGLPSSEGWRCAPCGRRGCCCWPRRGLSSSPRCSS